MNRAYQMAIKRKQLLVQHNACTIVKQNICDYLIMVAKM